MVDHLTPKERSRNMAAIKGKNTKPELIVRQELHRLGLRFRLHDKKLPGKPDLVFPKYKTVLFVNGCFWHGHESCKNFRIPKTRSEWWRDKISKTIERDAAKKVELEKLGWRVLVLWECQLCASNLSDIALSITRN